MNRPIFSIAAIILFAMPLQADEIRWGRGTANGNFIGNYTTAENWDGGVVPGLNDRARVDRGGTEMTLDSTIVANDFLFGVDEEPQMFTFMPTADVTTASNFFVALNRGDVIMDIQGGAAVSVGGNFLLGQQVFCCGGVPLFESDITVTVAGDVVVDGATILGDQYDGEPFFTDVLLDMSSGTLTADNIAFAPNGDLAAFLAAGNTMRVNVGDDALISLRGDNVANVQNQIDEGLYTTDSVQGTLGARYDAGSDLTLIEVGTPANCDFNGDMACDGVDADLLVEEIVAATNNPDFDLTGDGLVTRADLNDANDGWLLQAGEENIGAGRPYLEGDANLDTIVDGLDFIDWNDNKFTNLAAWTGGDFNADGVVDGLDFIIWNDNKFQSADGITAVPEPAGCMLLLAATVFGVVASARRAS